MAKKQEVMLMDKGFISGVIETLKELDVRGYESNKKLVIVTMELERAMNTSLPLEINTDNSSEQGDTEGKTEQITVKKI